MCSLVDFCQADSCPLYTSNIRGYSSWHCCETRDSPCHVTLYTGSHWLRAVVWLRLRNGVTGCNTILVQIYYLRIYLFFMTACTMVIVTPGFSLQDESERSRCVTRCSGNARHCYWYSVRISGRTPPVLTEVFRGFSSFPPGKFPNNTSIRSQPLPSKPFTIHRSSNDSTLYDLNVMYVSANDIHLYIYL
jgi:hypothetical protein